VEIAVLKVRVVQMASVLAAVRRVRQIAAGHVQIFKQIPQTAEAAEMHAPVARAVRTGVVPVRAERRSVQRVQNAYRTLHAAITAIVQR
jgi:hypothetical protein